MRSGWFASLLGVACLIGCVVSPKSPLIYRAAMQSLPERIDPRTNQVNIFHYINIHLFYPLFDANFGGGLESHFLSMDTTRALGKDFTQFAFCLKPGLKFSDGTPIKVNDLYTSLLDIHRVKRNLVRASDIKILSDCVAVRLEKSDPFYFDKLTGVQSTILKSRGKTDADPIGFGPYKLKSRSNDKLVLEANTFEVPGPFKSIEFVRTTPDSVPAKEPIDDWNHLYHTAIPQELTKGFQTIKRQVYKSYVLLVKIPDRNTRLKFVRCFDQEAFIKTLGMDLVPLPGILPHGMPGASVDFEKIIGKNAAAKKCGTPRSNRQTVRYYNYKSNQREGAAKFFSQFENQLPVRVAVEDHSLEETISDVNRKQPMITIVGSDAMEARAEEFFNGFVYPRSILPERLSEMESNLKRASETADKIAIGESIEAAHRELLKSGFVIPLGQFVSSQLYPAKIKNIRFADRVHGFPTIQLMEAE